MQAAGFQLERVSVRFGAVRALEQVSLGLAPGEAVGLVGPSGSGKTTLLRALNGSQGVDSGEVRVADRALRDVGRRELRDLRSHVGFIHQGLDLVPNLRVSHNVIAGRLGQMGFARSLGAFLFPSRALLREAYDVLDRVGIADKLFERTDRLSGGEQQRVALARALFQRPRALIADEPVASVDPARARDTVELLTRISKEEGLTLCMSLHNLELARRFLPRLVGLRDGRVVFDRSAREIDDASFDALYALDGRSSLPGESPLPRPRPPREARLVGG